MICDAIVLKSGLPCRIPAIPDGTRCKIHTNSILKHGIYEIQRQELLAKKKAAMNNFKLSYLFRYFSDESRKEELDTINKVYDTMYSELIKKQAEEMRTTGVNPDREARIRREAKKQQQQIARQQRILDMLTKGKETNDDLGNFASDKQNIHTTIAVEHTKKMIETIRTIAVPDEYMWNKNTCSKTPADIILKCNLTPDAAWQMMSKYANPETIYDMEEGIYGKVLDSVWQYVLNSPEKESLIAIVKTELEDNVGMCAQGNLTRICNILTGYMDGITPTENPIEVLGRHMPKIAEIEDVKERLAQANRVLLESKLPITEWLNWTVALFEDEVVDVQNGKLVLV